MKKGIRLVGMSPNPRARLTGSIYLLYFLLAITAQFLNSHNHEQFGLAVNFIAYACYAVLTVLFYYLLKPVNRYLSLIAAFFSAIGCTIGAIGLFDAEASQINPLLFFAPYCILIGWLIVRSTFLPRILGVLMVLAGLGWLFFLSPLVKFLSTYIEVLGVLGEGLLMLWLIVMGVNVQQWNKQRSDN
ncbi:MAG TPA: DUF4386 domain-containing protein [Puia sp.]|nr:DUF4386 domain-containing protein [Puia sp.]